MKKLSFAKNSRPGFNERTCLLKWNIVHWKMKMLSKLQYRCLLAEIVLTALDSKKPCSDQDEIHSSDSTNILVLVKLKGISFWKKNATDWSNHSNQIHLPGISFPRHSCSKSVCLVQQLRIFAQVWYYLDDLLPGNGVAFFCCMAQSVINYQECDEDKSVVFYSFFPFLS